MAQFSSFSKSLSEVFKTRGSLFSGVFPETEAFFPLFICFATACICLREANAYPSLKTSFHAANTLASP